MRRGRTENFETGKPIRDDMSPSSPQQHPCAGYRGGVYYMLQVYSGVTHYTLHITAAGVVLQLLRVIVSPSRQCSARHYGSQETDVVTTHSILVLQKVASELHPKVCNHGEGPY